MNGNGDLQARADALAELIEEQAKWAKSCSAAWKEVMFQRKPGRFQEGVDPSKKESDEVLLGIWYMKAFHL